MDCVSPSASRGLVRSACVDVCGGDVYSEVVVETLAGDVFLCEHLSMWMVLPVQGEERLSEL